MMSISDRRRFGHIAWIGLIVYVTIYDLIAMRRGMTTLSAEFHSLSRTKYWKYLLLAVWGVTTGHLFRVLPKKLDPFRSWIQEH